MILRYRFLRLAKTFDKFQESKNNKNLARKVKRAYVYD